MSLPVIQLPIVPTIDVVGGLIAKDSNAEGFRHAASGLAINPVKAERHPGDTEGLTKYK